MGDAVVMKTTLRVKKNARRSVNLKVRRVNCPQQQLTHPSNMLWFSSFLAHQV